MHHIVALRLRINKSRSKTSRRERIGNVVKKYSRIRVWNCRHFKKRRCLRRQKKELIRKRQYVVQTHSPTHRHLAIAKWIPSETNARLKISKSGITKKRIPEVWNSVVKVSQGREFAIRFRRNRGHFIT